MTPTCAPLTTLAQWEHLRKRRLLSLLLLVSLLISLGYIGYAALTSLVHQIPICGLGVGCILGAIWLNRQGYLTLASATYFLGSGVTILLGAQTAALADPLLLVWTCFLMTIFLVCLGFFVPPWMVLLSAVIETLVCFWYLLILNRAHLSLLFSPSELQYTFLYLCLLLYASAFLGIFYAVTTKRAVIRANRTVELDQAHRSISEAYSKLEVAHSALQRQAVTDGLTGLPNHGAIVEQIEAELLRCQSSQRDCVIIFVDIDHFKRINDTWGHAAGDAALRTVGQLLRKGIRKDDYIGRYGGEEFAILLTNIEQAQAFELAERLRSSIAETPCLWQRGEQESVAPMRLTASFGLAAYPLDGLTTRELLDTADAAMYTAKRSGRNRVCLPDEIDMALLKGDKNTLLPQSREQSILQTITTIAAYHDQETQTHANRTIRLAEAIMRALGSSSEDEVVLLRLAAQLHDIGKVGIPEAILQKPGPLSENEWDVIRRHPQIGQQILTQAKGQFGLVSHIVVAHHERWDGQGYPYGLAGQEIPLGARILSVIDSYDAMTSSRPYREALSVTAAREELQRGAGSQFDPQVVAVFLQMLPAYEAQVNIVPASVDLEVPF